MALQMTIFGWASNAYSPALCPCLSSHDAFSFIQEPPSPLIHVVNPALNAGRCGAVNGGARMVTAGNPGSICRF
jgi:hypothetical protein